MNAPPRVVATTIQPVCRKKANLLDAELIIGLQFGKSPETARIKAGRKENAATSESLDSASRARSIRRTCEPGRYFQGQTQCSECLQPRAPTRRRKNEHRPFSFGARSGGRPAPGAVLDRFPSANM